MISSLNKSHNLWDKTIIGYMGGQFQKTEASRTAKRRTTQARPNLGSAYNLLIACIPFCSGVSFFEPSCFSLLAVQPCPNQSCTLSPCSEVHLRSGVVSLENSFSMLYPSRSTVTPGRAKKLWRSLQWHPALGSVAADARVSPVALP